MSPLRGALIRIKNDGRTMPRLTQAHCIATTMRATSGDSSSSCPAATTVAVLGGFAEPDEWDLDIGLHNYDPIRAIHRRCVEFLPALADAEIDAAEPVRVGLQAVPPPERPAGARARLPDRPQLWTRRLGRHLLVGLRSRSPRSCAEGRTS